MLTLVAGRYVFRSSTGFGQTYCVEVAVDEGGRTSVLGVRAERGNSTPDCECSSQYPEELVEDIQTAVDSARALWRRDLVGTVEVLFRGDETLQVRFPWGSLGTDTYLVSVTSEDGTLVRAVDRGREGLWLVASAPLGSMAKPVKVVVAIYVPAYVASPLTFTLFFGDADKPVKRIPLPKPTNPEAYHVLLDPVGPYSVALRSKTRDYFEVEIGALPPPGELHRVRYLVTVP